MAAFSFAANHPEATIKLAMLDVAHPDESFSELRMLPEEGKFGERVTSETPAYTWWFAFHQVKRLSELLLARPETAKLYVAWEMHYHLENSSAISAVDLAVYENADSTIDAVRCSHAWYRAFPRDINDAKTYAKVQMPVLGLGSYLTGYKWLQTVRNKASDFRLVRIDRSAHYIQEEQPDVVARELISFFA